MPSVSRRYLQGNRHYSGSTAVPSNRNTCTGLPRCPRRDLRVVLFSGDVDHGARPAPLRFRHGPGILSRLAACFILETFVGFLLLFERRLKCATPPTCRELLPVVRVRETGMRHYQGIVKKSRVRSGGVLSKYWPVLNIHCHPSPSILDAQQIFWGTSRGDTEGNPGWSERKHNTHPACEDASCPASCSRSVDFPTPGSPPSITMLPGTRPPPSTRGSSVPGSGILPCFSAAPIRVCDGGRPRAGGGSRGQEHDSRGGGGVFIIMNSRALSTVRLHMPTKPRPIHWGFAFMYEETPTKAPSAEQREIFVRRAALRLEQHLR